MVLRGRKEGKLRILMTVRTADLLSLSWTTDCCQFDLLISFELIRQPPMAEGVADELLFIVAVASVFL